MTTFRNTALAAFASLTLFATANTADAAISGLYYDHTGRSAIQVNKCGSGLCGKIVWLRSKAHESVCGTRVIGGEAEDGTALSVSAIPSGDGSTQIQLTVGRGD